MLASPGAMSTPLGGHATRRVTFAPRPGEESLPVAGSSGSLAVPVTFTQRGAGFRGRVCFTQTIAGFVRRRRIATCHPV